MKTKVSLVPSFVASLYRKFIVSIFNKRLLEVLQVIGPLRAHAVDGDDIYIFLLTMCVVHTFSYRPSSFPLFMAQGQSFIRFFKVSPANFGDGVV